MSDQTSRPRKGFSLLDTAGFSDPVTVPVNVILTFDSSDDEGESQSFYDADVTVDLAAVDLDGIAQRTETKALLAIEVDVISQILDVAQRDLSDLCKISLCYGTGGSRRLGDPAFEGIVDYLCRYGAKYYFQPNQRDAYEQAIVDATGIASRTAYFVVA